MSCNKKGLPHLVCFALHKVRKPTWICLVSRVCFLVFSISSYFKLKLLFSFTGNTRESKNSEEREGRMSSTGVGSIYAPPAFQAAVYAKENNYCTAKVRFHLIKPPDIFLFLTNFKPKNIDNKQKILMPLLGFKSLFCPKNTILLKFFRWDGGKRSCLISFHLQVWLICMCTAGILFCSLILFAGLYSSSGGFIHQGTTMTFIKAACGVSYCFLFRCGTRITWEIRWYLPWARSAAPFPVPDGIFSKFPLWIKIAQGIITGFREKNSF